MFHKNGSGESCLIVYAVRFTIITERLQLKIVEPNLNHVFTLQLFLFICHNLTKTQEEKQQRKPSLLRDNEPIPLFFRLAIRKQIYNISLKRGQ